MSSIRGQSQYDFNRHLNFISTAAYGDSIFSYTTSQNSTTFATTGTIQSLLNLGTVTAGTAPVGRILRVNNKKLFPGANTCSTIITTGGGTATVTQLRSQMVGVIDIVTGISGFIDPNDSMFAIYNVDKAIDYPNDGGTPTDVAHRGPSVYTAGNVVAALAVTAGTTVTAGTGLSLTAGNLAITASAPQVIPYVATDSPYAFATNTGTLYSFTEAGAVNLNATTVPPIGSIIIIEFYNSTGGAIAVTLNTNFKSSGTVTPANSSASRISVTFISDGTNLVELFRSGSVTA